MSRRRLIPFSILLTISIIPILLNESTTLDLSTKLSSVLLFPVKTITSFLEFLTISNTRIEELEIMVNRLKLENSELRKNVFLDTTEYKLSEFELLKARVTGRDPSNINGFLFIDKGTEQGLYINQPVISTDGLIGKIKFTDAHHSIIETIENKGFAVSALDVKTAVHGIIKQRGNLIFDYIRITDEINIGDPIYTSGMSEIFPQGILVGTVMEIHQTDDLFFKKVSIKPSCQINRLTSVYLVFNSDTKPMKKEHELIPE